jgi:hypothetical protein
MSARASAKAAPDRTGTSDVADGGARGDPCEHLGHLSPREGFYSFPDSGSLIAALSCHAIALEFACAVDEKDYVAFASRGASRRVGALIGAIVY